MENDSNDFGVNDAPTVICIKGKWYQITIDLTVQAQAQVPLPMTGLSVSFSRIPNPVIPED